MDQDSSVGMVTYKVLDGPGLESRWGGRRFTHLLRPDLRPTQPPGGKAAGSVALTTHPPTSGEVNERVELYLWAFMACSRVTFTFTFTFMFNFEHNTHIRKGAAWCWLGELRIA